MQNWYRCDIEVASHLNPNVPAARASNFGIDGGYPEMIQHSNFGVDDEYPEMIHHSNFGMADGVEYELASGVNGIFDSVCFV